MNGKAATMLRCMRRKSKSDKREFNSLTHIQKGKVRRLHRNNVKLMYIDFLREVLNE